LINQNLHRQPMALDSAKHRQLKLRWPITDWSVADRLNAIFVAAAEFGEACREFPIVFVRAGKEADGSDQIAPIALLGLAQNQNLFLDGARWRAQYMPSVLRHYPFCIGRLDEKRFVICVDMACADAGQCTGAAVFEADGQPAPLLKSMQPLMESLENEIQRTRWVGKRLLELDVLREMRFDATLPGGGKHSVDGFLTVDEKKMTELPDAVVTELHRNGMLGLVHLHWASLGNMRRLLQWHGDRAAAAAAPAAAPAAAAT
jgi:hypothetical protein